METAVVLPFVSYRWVSFMGIWFHRGKLGTEMSQWPNDKCSLEARNFARVSNGVCVLPQSEVKGGSRVSLWSSVPVVLSAPDRKLVRISMRPEKMAGWDNDSVGKKGHLLCNYEHLSLNSQHTREKLGITLLASNPSSDRQRQIDPERLLASLSIQNDELPVQ